MELRKLIPGFILGFARKVRSALRKRERGKKAREGKAWKAEQLKAQLRELGIQAGDTVMLHSSLRAMGVVEGGAHTVITCFLSVLGADGTLAMPTFPAKGFNYDYLLSNRTFDVAETPSATGIITECFRKMAGVQRSLHPTEPVAARGKHASFIISGHLGEATPYTANSPFQRLCQLKAKIVLLGVDFNSLTNLHTSEDAIEDFKYPVYHSEMFDCELIDEHKKVHRVRTKVHDPVWSKRRRCNELIPLLRAEKLLTEGKLADAGVIVLRADELHSWMTEAYKRGITMYTPYGNEP